MTNLLLASLSSAWATQSQPVTDLEGTWDLTCASADLTVQVGLAGAIGGVPAAWDDTLVFPLDCDLTFKESVAIAWDVYGACVDAGLGRPECFDLARDVRRTAMDLSEMLAPVTFELGVSEGDLWGQLFGQYPATGTATWVDGTAQTWGYLVENNDGPQRGDLFTFGIGLDVDDTTPGLGCLGVGVGSVLGHVDPPTGDLVWDMDLAGTLVCAVDLGNGDWLAGDVALGLAVDTDGTPAG